MILHFVSDTGKYLNMNTTREIYNFHITRAECIQVSQQDYNRILQEMDFNCFGYDNDLTGTEAEADPLPFH